MCCLHGSDVLGMYCIVSDATLHQVITLEADRNIVLYSKPYHHQEQQILHLNIRNDGATTKAPLDGAATPTRTM